MGDSEFLWLGNHAATDLCNTEPVVDGRRVELLANFDALLRWAAESGVDIPRGASKTMSVRDASRTLRWALRLRTALRALLDPAAADAGTVKDLNDLLADDPGVLELRNDRGSFVVAVSSTHQLRRFRLDLARAVLDVFNYDLSLVRRCANPACVLLFLDVSKSGRRRWCDMATCGNRAKVAAHYARRREH